MFLTWGRLVPLWFAALFKTNVSAKKTYERHSKTIFEENGGSEYAQQKPTSKAWNTNNATLRYHVVGNDFERLVHEPNDTGLQKYSFLHHWFEDKKVRFYTLQQTST